MDYLEDWKYNKFSELLNTKEQRQTFYKLYKISKTEVRKRLYLFLLNPISNKIILDLIDSNALLTAEGLRNYLFEEKNVFNRYYKFKCKNSECKYNNDPLISDNSLYKKCPNCNEKIYLINKEQILNTLLGLYLNYFDFYLLSEYDKTIYLVHNKFADKYYLKASDEALSNWLYVKLLENGCDVDKYIFAIYGECKNPKNILLRCVKEHQLIKVIDGINFKPVKNKLFTENNRTYFNIYAGNDNLNSYSNNKECEILKDCPNIYELLYNLTGHDEKGIQYLLDVLSMIMQEPYIKTKQLIIFYGEEASGKGTFYDLILKPLFDGYITKILGKKIKSSFNGFMSKNLVLVLEEVKADKDEEDTLKELVTEEYILINTKGLPERYENNYLTMFGFSNEQNPINAGKRRGVYFRSRTLGGTTDKSPEFRKKYETEIPKEFPCFLSILKNRKYDRVDVMKGYETEAKQQVLDQNMSLIERFYEELCSYDSLTTYIDNLISNGTFRDLDLSKHLHKSLDVNYIKAEFLLYLYNEYLKRQRYNVIQLNRFSQFWQLIKINKSDKTHWNRLEIEKRKFQFVNLDIINSEIKKRFDEE